MNALSDSESSDSDTGRRFKTESTRTREDAPAKKAGESSKSISSRKDYRRYRSKSRSRSRTRSRTRSRDRNVRKRSKSREKSYRKYENSEKSSKRRDSRDHKPAEKDRDKDRSRDKDKERSSHHSSSSKSNEKHASSSVHKKSHSKLSTTDERNSHKSKSQSIDTASDVNEKHKKHKSKDKNRDDRSIKSNDHEHRRSSDKQSEHFDTPQKRSIDVKPSPERNGKPESRANADEILICGPSLPPHMLKSSKHSEPIDAIVPTTSTEKRYGPSLPRDFVAHTKEYSTPAPDAYDEPKNDAAHVELSDSDDDGLIGPVLDHMANKSEAYLELEKRALELKLAKLNEREKRDSNSVREREEWMLELPELRTVTDLGLTARQFRTKERDEIKDRSSWTETPRDRDEKQKKKVSSHDDLVKIRHQKTEKLYRDRRDAEQEEAARKHKKKHKRDESLLDLHQKKLKKKAQKDSEPTERRPFSRDTDLKVNRFDDAQKKSILKKAQLLDTRFNSGQSKYL